MDGHTLLNSDVNCRTSSYSQSATILISLRDHRLPWPLCPSSTHRVSPSFPAFFALVTHPDLAFLSLLIKQPQLDSLALVLVPGVALLVAPEVAVVNGQQRVALLEERLVLLGHGGERSGGGGGDLS